MLGSLQIPFTLSEHDRNACNGLQNTQCPIEAGTTLVYALGMPVEAPIVGVTVDLQFHLADDRGNRVVCYRYAQTIIG